MIPDNEFSNDLEYMKSMDEAYHNVQKLEQSEKALRFQTRLDQSNAMKVSNYTEAINFGNDDIDKATFDWKKEVESFNQKLKDDERERVYKAIRKVWSDGFRWDLSGEDLIQSVIIHLKKDKN